MLEQQVLPQPLQGQQVPQEGQLVRLLSVLRVYLHVNDFDVCYSEWKSPYHSL